MAAAATAHLKVPLCRLVGVLIKVIQIQRRCIGHQLPAPGGTARKVAVELRRGLEAAKERGGLGCAVGGGRQRARRAPVGSSSNRSVMRLDDLHQFKGACNNRDAPPPVQASSAPRPLSKTRCPCRLFHAFSWHSIDELGATGYAGNRKSESAESSSALFAGRLGVTQQIECDRWR